MEINWIKKFVDSLEIVDESEEEIAARERIKKTEDYYKFLESSNIPVKFRGASAKKIDKKIFKEMVDNRSILLKGLLGRGKSFAASAYLIEAYLRMCASGMFIRCHNLEELEIDKLKALLRKATYAKIVVFDDIGYIKNNAFVARLVTSVILNRLEDEKDTIMTTNESIKDIFDKRDLDKIDADYHLIEFKGEKLRKSK